MQTILTNAKLILDDEVVSGTISFDETGILDVAQGRSASPSATDINGDFVAPGLIELHTDNMEKHFVPRPGVFWPNPLAAALAHDAQMAAAGVTTVYDSLCCGAGFGEKSFRRKVFPQMMQAISDGVDTKTFRIEHKIHLRCELTAVDFLAEVEPYIDHPLLHLASLMDHTPGQRQWRNLEDLRRYNQTSGEKSNQQFDDEVRRRMTEGPENVRQNWSAAVEMFKTRGIPLATHDDTTEADVEAGHEAGVSISEFPTTIEAARAAKERGLGTIAGAPNVVRGGSHSGGISVRDLTRLDLLDGLSSDYVPSSLLQAVALLHQHESISLPAAVAMVTWRIGDLAQLTDRGRLNVGLRADLVRFSLIGETPVVRSTWSAGQRAF